MKFINFAIVKFSLFMTIGILSAHNSPNYSHLLSIALLICVILLGITWFIVRKHLFQHIYFGILTYLIFFLIGFLSYQLKTPISDKHLFANYSKKGNYVLIDVKITDILNSGSFQDRFLVKVNFLDGQHVSGSSLLQIKKDSLPSTISIDDRLLISAKMEPLKPSLNPNQFDYSKFMSNKGIYHQIRISKKDIVDYKKGRSSPKGVADGIRESIIDKVSPYSSGNDEFSIFKALVLGQRDDVNDVLYEQYANAGAIHMLAVSGLHVGMIYLLLLTLLRPLKKIHHGTILVSMIVIICLWGYASITGLSPSVVRAVTMFSLFAIAKNMERQTNSFNTLFLSYLILILIQPQWLFQIGFQMSYLAVFFIIWIQPEIYSYYHPKYYIDRLIWGISTVSIAAQLGVLPLSLYYFNQFPGLFLITNIVILPFLSLLLGGGIIIVILASMGSLHGTISDFYWSLIELLNEFISWVSSKDDLIISEIHFTLEKTIASYMLLIALILLWKKFNYHRLVYSLIGLCLLIGVFIKDQIDRSRNELVIFHKNRQSLLGIKDHESFTLFKNVLTETSERDHMIRSYLRSTNTKNYSEGIIPNIFSFNNILVYIPDSLETYPNTKKMDLIYLTMNPRVNLDRLIDQLGPKSIIADGNNYSSFIVLWKKTCEKRNIPFHYTGEKGAYIIRQN